MLQLKNRLSDFFLQLGIDQSLRVQILTVLGALAICGGLFLNNLVLMSAGIGGVAVSALYWMSVLVRQRSSN